MSIIFGEWPKDDLRRAFVDGAKWWEWHKTKASMWPSDIREVEKVAEVRYPLGKVREDTTHVLPDSGVSVRYEWAKNWDKASLVYGAWLRGRMVQGNPVNAKEGKFAWEQWEKGGFDLIISKEDYKEIFPGM